MCSYREKLTEFQDVPCFDQVILAEGWLYKAVTGVEVLGIGADLRAVLKYEIGHLEKNDFRFVRI